MKTPIYDALQAYADRQPIRFHMPGHKGHSAIPAWNPLYALEDRKSTRLNSSHRT